MAALKQKTLALFFSRKVSLAIWQKIGSLSREVKPYIELARAFKKVYFFTYGNENELSFKEFLPSNIEIVSGEPTLFYYLFLPAFKRKILKKVDILKTNQMSAALPAVLAKMIFRKKLVLRCGYEWLNVLAKEKKAR